MNIKEIIAELELEISQLHTSLATLQTENRYLDASRIAVTEKYEADDVRYLQRIAELEAQNRERDGQSPCWCKLLKAAKQRIDELEMQVPKVVVPHMSCKSFSLGDRMYCDCGELLACDFSYCPHCGAKLNWSKS